MCIFAESLHAVAALQLQNEKISIAHIIDYHGGKRILQPHARRDSPQRSGQGGIHKKWYADHQPPICRRVCKIHQL